MKVKYASAHDMRRSFGERWASRVMPQVLMELMRHESIDTTLRYYVGRNAQQTQRCRLADDLVRELTLGFELVDHRGDPPLGEVPQGRSGYRRFYEALPILRRHFSMTAHLLHFAGPRPTAGPLHSG